MLFIAEGAKIALDIETLIVAGWTGRDLSAVQHHIDELSALGVAAPSQIPLFYRVSRSLLAQSAEIEVLGPSTSGEIEPLLINSDGVLWLGLGSDHTDRELEVVSVAASKQACPKPVAQELWRFDEVAPHLDQMTLRCEIAESGAWVLYQEGTLASITPLQKLANLCDLGPSGAMLCGTLGAIGGVRPATIYRMSLFDPVRDRSLQLEYRVITLPIVL
ncbi:MAG: DUF2848 domain-containing protein [Pseudomonadota bacterium]